MDLDRVLAEDGAVAAVAARLRALDGARVDVSLLRAAGAHGDPVRRSGRLQLASPGADLPPIPGAAPDRMPARVVDDAGVPLVTLLERDRLSVLGETVRALLRPSFRIEIVASQPATHRDAGGPGDLHGAALALAAELEAAFRSALRMRPDPDPAASARARDGVPPTETPLADGSIRFGVDHRSATLHPDGDGVRLTCIRSTIRGLRQHADRFEPAGGTRYALDRPSVERLGAVTRAFLSGDDRGFAMR